MKLALIGGHISPALALLEELEGRAQCIVLGRKYALEGDKAFSLEYKICQEKKIPFFPISSGRLQRKLTLNTLPSLLKIPQGFWQAYKILRKEKPDIVVGFGGYLCFPVIICAKLLKIPIVLHEQTQHAGLSNRVLAPLADRVCVSFISSLGYFPSNKTILTGNPLRKEIFEVRKKISVPKGKLIYITGGSTGSHFINNLVREVIAELVKDFIILHQTGESSIYQDFEELENIKHTLPSELKNNYILKKHITSDEIGWVFNQVDLIVSRAGINTVCEILVLSKRCLLIPLPHGQKNEQERNAELVKQYGIGEYLKQNEITPSKFVEKVYTIISDKDKYLPNNKNFHMKDASKKLAHVLQSVYEKKAATSKTQSNS